LNGILSYVFRELQGRGSVTGHQGLRWRSNSTHRTNIRSIFLHFHCSCTSRKLNVSQFIALEIRQSNEVHALFALPQMAAQRQILVYLPLSLLQSQGHPMHPGYSSLTFSNFPWSRFSPVSPIIRSLSIRTLSPSPSPSTTNITKLVTF